MGLGVRLDMAAFHAAVLLGWGADRALGLPFGVRQAALPLAVALTLGVLLFRVWRGRGAANPEQVALFVEARTPGLEYALVTAARPAGKVDTEALEASIASRYRAGGLAPDFRRALLLPLAAAVVLAGILMLIPREQIDRVFHPRPGDLLLGPRAGAGARNRLADIVNHQVREGLVQPKDAVLDVVCILRDRE